MNRLILSRQRLRSTVDIIVLVTLATVGQRSALAEVITSPLGDYQVGINTLGNLFDPVADVGFRRIADGYDPIRPFTSREAYGVSAGANSGWADPNNQPGVEKNLTKTQSSFQANSASVRTVLHDGNPDLNARVNFLQIDQDFGFVDGHDNLLQISIKISNLSPSVRRVLFSRNVDWDIAPSERFESITASSLALPVLDGSYDGFEDPNPLVPFALSTGAGGGFFEPDDLGAGLRIDLGNLQPAGTPDNISSVDFSIFYAIGSANQTEAELRAQLGFAGGTSRINTAALGFGIGNSLVPTELISGAAFVPEPSSAVLLGIGAMGMLWFALGSQAKRQAGMPAM